MSSFKMLGDRLKNSGYPVHSLLLFIHLDEAMTGKRVLNQSDYVDLEVLLTGLASELERTK